MLRRPGRGHIMWTMDMNPAQQQDSSSLHRLQLLCPASDMADALFDMIGHSRFFADFTRDDIDLLAPFMQIYRANPGETIIHEDDNDDFMLLILEGVINIV